MLIKTGSGAPATFPDVNAPTARERDALALARRKLQASLSGALHGLTVDRVQGRVDLQCEVATQLPAGSGGLSLQIEAGSLRVAWLLPPEAAAMTVAGMMGSKGGEPPRELTALDRRLLGLLGRHLAEGLAGVLPGRTAPRASLLDRCSVCGPGGRTASWGLNLSRGEHAATGWLVGAAEPLMTELGEMPGCGSAHISRDRVLSAPVQVEAILPGPTLQAGDLLSLRPGDVLRLSGGELGVQLRSSGRAIAAGRGGASDGKLAVCLTELSEERGKGLSCRREE